MGGWESHSISRESRLTKQDWLKDFTEKSAEYKAELGAGATQTIHSLYGKRLQKTMENPPRIWWVNQLFRLGHAAISNSYVMLC